MASPSNAHIPPGALSIGLIGAGAELARLRTLLAASDWLAVHSQSGDDESQRLPGAAWHDDPRVLLMQGELDGVLLASSTRGDLEHAALALEHHCPSWRLPPLARTFAEAAELVTRMRRGGTLYRVASWWEFIADHAWRELHWPDHFSPLYSEAVIRAPGPESRSWRSHLNDTAGGVLALDGYGLLEALVAVRGLPESVSAATGCYGRGAVRETEDVAAAVLRYRAGGIGVIRALWDAGPPEQRLTHVGMRETVRLTDADLTLLADGEPVDQRPLGGDWLTGDLLRFVEQVRSEARDRAAATLERHLAVTALLEAIYLSARTGQPESPRKLYEIQGLSAPE